MSNCPRLKVFGSAPAWDEDCRGARTVAKLETLKRPHASLEQILLKLGILSSRCDIANPSLGQAKPFGLPFLEPNMAHAQIHMSGSQQTPMAFNRCEGEFAGVVAPRVVVAFCGSMTIPGRGWKGRPRPDQRLPSSLAQRREQPSASLRCTTSANVRQMRESRNPRGCLREADPTLCRCRKVVR